MRYVWRLAVMAVTAAVLGNVIAAPAGAATIAYPDLRVIVPASSIAIATPSPGVRELEFTHITWNAGAGPLEIHPVYNAATGVSQGLQMLYTSPSPGVWTYDMSVPIVGPMVWNPPSDYRFPFAAFWLYSATASGGLGTLVATSPKVDFCMTPDTFVGGVPDTPSEPSIPETDCVSPTGTLGLTVGWGDEYDQTDAGEDIDISSLPDGTYWLRAEADPDHDFQEADTADNITDTELSITGSKVTVLEQTHPDSTPPAVTLTSPSPGSTAQGADLLTTSVSGSDQVRSVQFLLDGEPLGAPVTSPPYTLCWVVGDTALGAHELSAQATASDGLVGTAPAVPVTVSSDGSGGSCGPGAPGGSGGGSQPQKPAPAISVLAPPPGAIVAGSVQVDAYATDTVTIRSVRFRLDGRSIGSTLTRAPFALTWNTTSTRNGPHTLSATVTDVTGHSATSAPVAITVQNSARRLPCFVTDANVTVNGRGSVTTAAFTTAVAGDQLLAFVSSDGPGRSRAQSVVVSGAGLRWHLVRRANAQPGDAEIWWATAHRRLVRVRVTARPRVGGFAQALSVLSMQMSTGIGSSAAAGAARGRPSVTLRTAAKGTLVFAVGEDWDSAMTRAVGANQIILHQYLDTGTGDTMWSQFTGSVVPLAGTRVTMNDGAPSGDHWNFAAVELLGDGD